MYRRFARMGLVLSLATGAMSFATLEKHVTVVVEGEPVAVRTFADNVGDVLDRAGIEVRSKDRVRPSMDESLDDVDRIVVRRAKPVTLVVDGEPERVTVTALRVEGALAEAGFQLHPKDIVRPSPEARVRPGTEIRYRPAERVRILVGKDEVRRVVTTKPRVRGVLKHFGVKLGPLDRVVPSQGSRHLGEAIRVFRVKHVMSTRLEAVPFKTVTRRSGSLDRGQTKVHTPGKAGQRKLSIRSTLVNGEVESRRVVGSTLVQRPVDRVVLVGTRLDGCRCDRGSQVGKASWYHRSDGMTAAHRSLPFGTVVRVENRTNGRWINVVIRDRGPFIDGRIIDLSDEAFAKLASLSKGVINVRIRW